MKAELKEEPVVSTTDEKGDRKVNEKKPGPPFLRRSLLLLLALAASLLLLSQQQPTKIYDWKEFGRLYLIHSSFKHLTPKVGRF